MQKLNITIKGVTPPDGWKNSAVHISDLASGLTQHLVHEGYELPTQGAFAIEVVDSGE